ncbi:LamG-like jellyroll fold domain-containing protein [Candidatus Poribacteria bacterium]
MRIILTSIGLTVVFLLVVSSSFALDPGAVADGHVWLMDSIVGAEVPDDSANSVNGVIVGNPVLVPGANGMALKLDGVDDAIHIPDSQFINITNGPWSNRTVTAAFNCANVSKSEKQTIYEEGGLTRGFSIYVFEGEVYVGGWNKDATQVDWNPGEWMSAPVESNKWHGVALVLRDGTDTVEADKFEMWLDGDLVGKAPGSNIYNHADDNGIGDTNTNVVFHDGDGPGSGWFFEGMIDEVWVLNQALSEAELGDALTSVEPVSKLTSSWGAIKSQR